MARHGRRQTRNVQGGKYHWELQDWVNKLYLTYPNKCIICGTRKNLEPHHILQVKPYDELYASVSNGCLICKDCHRDYHERYNEVNPVTLVQYAKKQKQIDKGLKNQYKKLKLVEKYYRKETERLRKILEENNIKYD